VMDGSGQVVHDGILLSGNSVPEVPYALQNEFLFGDARQ
jgi:hypothetical protein